MRCKTKKRSLLFENPSWVGISKILVFFIYLICKKKGTEKRDRKKGQKKKEEKKKNQSKKTIIKTFLLAV